MQCCIVLYVYCVLYTLHIHAYNHSLPPRKYAQTHMWLSSVSDPTLEGMVPFKPLIPRVLLGKGGGGDRR
jgi:hypothetical protein